MGGRPKGYNYVNTKLAIVGTHKATRDNAPFGDESYDIWVFNEAPQADWCKRWTACFQMHKPEVYTSPHNFVNGEHWAWLQQDHGADKVIWMQDVDSRVPNSARYPREEIKASLPPAALWEFTSTVTMAMALALYQGYEHVEVYGVSLESNSEYTYQLQQWLFWVGAAKMALGDNLILKSGLSHFEGRAYGYEGETQIDRAHFEKRITFWQAEVTSLENKLYKLRSRINDCLLDKKAAAFDGLIVDAQNTAQELGEAAGCLQEAKGYAAREDPIPRQQFERRGAQAQEDGDAERTLMDKKFGEMQYVFNVWRLTGNYDALKQLRAFYAAMLEHAVKVGGNLGVWHENARYMMEYDSRVTAAGGERTLTALGVNNGGD
jgi:hypothetical protein